MLVTNIYGTRADASTRHGLGAGVVSITNRLIPERTPLARQGFFPGRFVLMRMTPFAPREP